MTFLLSHHTSDRVYVLNLINKERFIVITDGINAVAANDMAFR